VGHNGKEIVDLSSNNKIMATEGKNDGGGFEVGAGRALFETLPDRWSGVRRCL